jgi:HSP20 family protein
VGINSGKEVMAMDRRLHPVANQDVHAPIMAPLWDAATRPLAAWTAWWPALTGMVAPALGAKAVADTPLARGLMGPIANLNVGIPAPSIEIGEDDDTITVKAEVPGLSEDQLELSFDDGVLTIAGETSVDTGPPESAADSGHTGASDAGNDKRGEAVSGTEGPRSESAHCASAALRERSYGRFVRRVPVGHGIDADRIDATFHDGVLTITLPKTEQAGHTEIPIRKAA